jgi:hypothetical protein
MKYEEEDSMKLRLRTYDFGSMKRPLESNAQVLGSFLTKVEWWRVLLDEAPHLLGDRSFADLVINRLSAVNWWSISGTEHWCTITLSPKPKP